MQRNCCIARSRPLIGSRQFSVLLLSQRPVSWRSAAPVISDAPHRSTARSSRAPILVHASSLISLGISEQLACQFSSSQRFPQSFALGINGAPESEHLAKDLHKHLVEATSPTATFHLLDPSLSDLRSEHRSEPIPQEPECLMADVNAVLVKQVPYFSPRTHGMDAQHHGKPDGLRTRLEVSKRTVLRHRLTQAGTMPDFKPVFF